MSYKWTAIKIHEHPLFDRDDADELLGLILQLMEEGYTMKSIAKALDEGL